MGATASIDRDEEQFRFSGRGIVRQRPAGHHNRVAMIEAMTGDGARLKILCMTPGSSAAEKLGERLMGATTLAAIDGLFTKMRAVLVETVTPDGLSYVVHGDEEALPERLREAIETASTPVLPERVDQGFARRFGKPWSIDAAKRAKCFGMIRTMGWALPNGKMPEDPDEFEAYYEEVKAEYWKQKEADAFLPSGRQISYARAIQAVTGHEFGFDLNTATRSQVADYITAHRPEFERNKPGAVKTNA